MTKSPRKLVLHKETLRALTSIELRRAVAGGVGVLDFSAIKNCPAADAIAAPDK